MTKQELLEKYTVEQLANIIIDLECKNDYLEKQMQKWYKECQKHREVYNKICHLEDLYSEIARLEKRVAEYNGNSENCGL